VGFELMLAPISDITMESRSQQFFNRLISSFELEIYIERGDRFANGTMFA